MSERTIIMGAAGRDFHLFNTVFRDNPEHEVVAFTATQIPGIDGRIYPASLCGAGYPNGIAIRPESELEELIAQHAVTNVVHAYSDLSHEQVMHTASRVLATGADFRLIGPTASMLHSTTPVVAVCAVRTGCGKSQTSRRVGRVLMDAGLRTVLIRHPMPYGDLERMAVQRFASLDDIDASDPTIEEREEYETPVSMGMVVYAGVDYARILAEAQTEADVIIWDGGNNDFPFVRPDVLITVTDPLRPGHERHYHPGETNLRMADVVVINKVDAAEASDVAALTSSIQELNPSATIVRAASPVTLAAGQDLNGARVVVVEDGPTITHGGMPYGAGTVAARAEGAAELVDPRPFAVGSIAETYAAYPDIGPVLPAMGYGQQQMRELAETLQAANCDVVVVGTPIDISRVIDVGHPVRRATYELAEIGEPDLHDVLSQHLPAWHRMSTTGAP